MKTTADGTQRVNRTAVRRHRLDDAPSDFAYWQSRPYTERLRALEEIRREVHGWDDDSQPRLQRVVRVIALESLQEDKRAVGRHQDLADLDKLE